MDTTKTRTITLTDRPPVRIREDDWPEIASALWGDGKVPAQHNRQAAIRVREHQDGRVIVYAVHWSSWVDERGYRGGELLDAGSDVPAAVRRVGVRAADFSAAPWPTLIEETIADLPPEEL